MGTTETADKSEKDMMASSAVARDERHTSRKLDEKLMFQKMHEKFLVRSSPDDRV